MGNSSSLTLPRAVSNTPDALDAGACVFVRDVLESPLALLNHPGCRVLDVSPQLHGVSGIPRDKAQDSVSPLEPLREVAVGELIAGTVSYRACVCGCVACVW